MTTTAMTTAFNAWLATLPAAGWRGTVPELADVLGVGEDKLATWLNANRNAIAAAGWQMEFVLFKYRREVRFARPRPPREPKPETPPALKKRKPAKPKPLIDTGVTLPARTAT